MFKDETNYFAALNVDEYFGFNYDGWNYHWYFSGTNHHGGLILASKKNSYSSCYNIPYFSDTS